MTKQMMKHTGKILAATMLPLALGVGTSLAQDTTNGASAQDKHFLKEFSQDTNYEIKTSQLALQKTSSQDVKEYAQMVVTDHEQIKSEIRDADKSINMKPVSPTSMSLKDHAEYDKLKVISGGDFDKAYIKGLLNGNEEIQKDEKSESKDSSVEAVKTLATHSAEMDTKHAEKAKQLAQAHHVEK